MKYLFIISTLIVFAAATANALNEPEDSLILYFSFDALDGQNTIDHSKYENHGEIVGNPKHVEGRFGKALELNGTSAWIVVPHNETLTVDQSVTVMAWINTERHTGPNNQRWQGILSKGNNPRSYSFYTESPSQCLHFSIGGQGSVCNKQVALEEWQHVAAQIDEERTHRYWVNGEPAGAFAGKNPPPGNADTADVFVGRTHEGQREFLGMIDEVKIWNRALTHEEIITQMELGYFELFTVDPRQKLATTWSNLKTSEQ